jgi:hypothetical protein
MWSPFGTSTCQHCLSVSGLSAPVPRGRKGKKTKNQLLLPELKNADWLATCNPEVVLHDDGYKKHLKQHCNKWVCPSPGGSLAQTAQAPGHSMGRPLHALILLSMQGLWKLWSKLSQNSFHVIALLTPLTVSLLSHNTLCTLKIFLIYSQKSVRMSSAFKPTVAFSTQI